MITVGIDVGSISTKIAVLREAEIVYAAVSTTGYNAKSAGQRIYEQALERTGIGPGEIHRIVATGYGRNSVSLAHKSVTEITCHAAGGFFLNPRVKTIVDIGGQDSKVIALGADGAVKDFAMNDKCAAGTGRFLEVMARALEMDMADLGRFALDARSPAAISSLCTVFAESEVISLIARGEERSNIIAGIHESISARVTAMARRVGIAAPLMMTGGVARNAGVVNALEKRLGMPVEVSPHAQVNGAIGAALVAQRI